MPVGDLIIVIVGREGRQMARLERNILAYALPAPHAIELFGEEYIIDRVRLSDDEDDPSPEQKYMRSTVYVRSRDRGWMPSDPIVPTPFTPGSPGRKIRAHLFPVGLIGAFLAHGYREMWLAYKRQERIERLLRAEGASVTEPTLDWRTAQKRCKHAWRATLLMLREQAELMGQQVDDIDDAVLEGETDESSAQLPDPDVEYLQTEVPYLRLIKRRS